MRWLIAAIVALSQGLTQNTLFISGDFSLQDQSNTLIAQLKNKTLWKVKSPLSNIEQVATNDRFIALMGGKTSNDGPMIAALERSKGNLLWKAPAFTYCCLIPRYGRLELIGNLIYLDFDTGGEPGNSGTTGIHLKTGERLWEGNYAIVKHNRDFALLRDTLGPANIMDYKDNPYHLFGYRRIYTPNPKLVALDVLIGKRAGCGELELPPRLLLGYEYKEDETSIYITRNDQCGEFTRKFRWMP